MKTCKKHKIKYEKYCKSCRAEYQYERRLKAKANKPIINPDHPNWEMKKGLKGFGGMLHEEFPI